MELKTQKSTGDQSPNIIGDNATVNYSVEKIQEKVKQVPNEVESIMRLISYLSELSERNPEAEKDISTEKNLVKKLEERFAPYQAAIESDYKNLHILYSEQYEQARALSEIDDTCADEIAMHLVRRSREVLQECDNDPLRAINSLTTYYITELGDGEFKFSETAIHYFLLRELANCNVFPNII